MYDIYQGFYNGYGGCFPTFNASMTAYWERSLFQRMTTLFKIEGLPDGWDKDAFKYGLFRMGFLPVFLSKKYGRVFQPGTPAFVGLYYQPTAMQISSPFFNFTRPLQIGSECEVIKLTPDYRGVWDIISKYASELVRQEVAIRQSQNNARFAYAAVAEDEKSAKTLKAIFERLGNGDDAVVYDKMAAKRNPATGEITNPWTQFDRDLKSNFILPDLIEGRREILTDFYREMGLRVAPDKKERIGTHESYSYDAEAFSRLLVYNESLQESLDRVNNFLGTEIVATPYQQTGEEEGKNAPEFTI